MLSGKVMPLTKKQKTYVRVAQKQTGEVTAFLRRERQRERAKKFTGVGSQVKDSMATDENADSLPILSGILSPPSSPRTKASRFLVRTLTPPRLRLPEASELARKHAATTTRAKSKQKQASQAKSRQIDISETGDEGGTPPRRPGGGGGKKPPGGPMGPRIAVPKRKKKKKKKKKK